MTADPGNVAVTGLPDGAMLRLNNVSHSFSARAENFAHAIHWVLEDVTLSVQRGEVLGITGLLGAGRTERGARHDEMVDRRLHPRPPFAGEHDTGRRQTKMLSCRRRAWY